MGKKFIIMNIITKLFSIALFALVGACQTPPAGSNIYISNKVAEDATFSIYKALMDNPQLDNSTITLEKGVYHMWPEKALEHFCNISNHNDILTRIAFPIIGAKNVTIDGGGSKVILHGRLIPFWIENSSNIKIKNLTVDYADTFHSEGTVIAVDKSAGTIDLRYRDEDKYEIRNGEIIFIKPYYQFPLGQTMYYDAKTKAPLYNTQQYGLGVSAPAVEAKRYNAKDYKYKSDKNDEYILGRGTANGVIAQHIGEQTVRFNINRRTLPPIGSVLVAKGERGPNRFAPGARGLNSVDLSFENVTIHHCGGMGFIMDNCENVDIYRCKLIPSQGNVISATADATHFVGCRGLVSLRESTFQSQLDDGMNVHGVYQEVMDVLDSNSVTTRIGHFQQLGIPLGRVGDKVGVVRLEESFDHYAELTIKSIKKVNGRCYIISFEEALPERISDVDLLENLSAYPEILVEGCDMSRNRARGILVSTPIKTTIRNNYFSNEVSAILLPVENSFWYESGNATNVVIENNVFQDCMFGGKDFPVIKLNTDSSFGNIAFRNILIKGNTFNHYDNFILKIHNADGLTFEDNIITNSGTYPQNHTELPVVQITNSKNIKFANNDYQGKAKVMVTSDDDKKYDL